MSALVPEQGWPQEVTIEQLAPVVDDAWRELSSPAGANIARKAVAMVMQAYRTPDLTNPAAFVELAVGALEDYPPIVFAELASPKVGIIRDSKFPPTIAELVQWCEGKLKHHKGVVERGSLQLDRMRSAKELAAWKMKEAAEEAKRQAEWEAGEPERRRKAEEAAKLAKAAALKAAAHDALQRRQGEARAAWMKKVFADHVDDAVIVERLCSLTDEEQEEATKREMQMPGAGSLWLSEKVRT